MDDVVLHAKHEIVATRSGKGGEVFFLEEVAQASDFSAKVIVLQEWRGVLVSQRLFLHIVVNHDISEAFLLYGEAGISQDILARIPLSQGSIWLVLLKSRSVQISRAFFP